MIIFFFLFFFFSYSLENFFTFLYYHFVVVFSFFFYCEHLMEFFCFDNSYYFLHITNCYSHLGCYTHNVSVGVLCGLLQVSSVILGNLLGIQNLSLYLVHGGRLFSFCNPCLGVCFFASITFYLFHCYCVENNNNALLLKYRLTSYLIL